MKYWLRKLLNTSALAAVICLLGSIPVARAAQQQAAGRPQQQHVCPSKTGIELALGHASDLLRLGQFTNAVDALRPLSALHCDPRANLLLAAALEASGDISQAEETLQKAHSTWPANNSIAASLAREYMSAGQTDRAVRSLDHFRATAATPVQEMELATTVYIAAHQLSRAQTLSQVSYKYYPSIRTLLLFANVLQLEGRYKDVLVLLNAKEKQYGSSPPFLITLAESEYDANIFDAARSHLEHAISLDPGIYQAHYLLGNVLLKQGDIDKAKAQYSTAIDLAPNQARTYYQLALALRAQHDESGEIAVLTKALALDTNYALAHSELGRVFMTQNRPHEAITQLSLAIRDNPKDEQAYYLLSRAYSKLGDMEQSNEMATRLAEVRSQNQRHAKSSAPTSRSAN